MRTTIISSPAPVLATTTVWTAESRERSRSQREPQLDMQRARWCRIAPCSAGDHDSNPTLYERQSVPQPPTSHPNLRRLLRPSPLRCEHCSGANTCLNRARLLLPHAPPLLFERPARRLRSPRSKGMSAHAACETRHRPRLDAATLRTGTAEDTDAQTETCGRSGRSTQDAARTVHHHGPQSKLFGQLAHQSAGTAT